MKTLILLAIACAFTMSAKSCKYDATDTHPTLLNVNAKVGYRYPITKSCPIEAGEPEEIPLEKMAGWWCFHPDEAAEMRREHQADCK